MKKSLLTMILLTNITACKADNSLQQPSQNSVEQSNNITISHERAKPSSSKIDNSIHKETQNSRKADIKQAKADGFHQKFEKELIIYAANANSYKKYPTGHFDLYNKIAQSSSNDKPLLSIITKEPIKTEYILTKEHDTGETKGEYVFRNKMDLVFYGNNEKSKPVRMNLSNSSYISVSTPYENNEFTIAKLEMEGEGLSADTYDWTSCLIVYNKNINRILSLNPFGCAIDTPNRNSMQNMSRKIARHQISFDSFSSNNGVYTLKLTNTPKLEVGELDKNNAKQLIYQFKINPQASSDKQLETIKSTYIYKQNKKPVADFPTDGFAFEVDD